MVVDGGKRKNSQWRKKEKRIAIAIFVDQRVNLLGVACDNESNCG
jgi:hypothetical protein